MKELLRMQKLDHIRAQVTSQRRHSIENNPNFNKTVDFRSGSYLHTMDNDSMTQDSLFISQENMHGPNTMRANISGSPAGYLNTNQSSAFKTVNQDDLKLNQSSVDRPPAKERSCQRIFKPSQRNKVIMTRSVDVPDRDIIGSQGHNSIFGTNKITARMHVNNNTVLELCDPTVPKFQPRDKKLSPFVLKAQRKQFVQEREAEIQK